MCLKRLITKRSEPFHLLRMMGLSVPSLHIYSLPTLWYIIAFLRRLHNAWIDPVKIKVLLNNYIGTCFYIRKDACFSVSKLIQRIFYGKDLSWMEECVMCSCTCLVEMLYLHCKGEDHMQWYFWPVCVVISVASQPVIIGITKICGTWIPLRHIR